MKLKEIFVVSQISEDVILGMLFLANHDCRMDFTKPVMTIREQELVGTNQYKRLMASWVQMVKKTTIFPGPKFPSLVYLPHITMHSKESSIV